MKQRERKVEGVKITRQKYVQMGLGDCVFCLFVFPPHIRTKKFWELKKFPMRREAFEIWSGKNDARDGQ